MEATIDGHPLTQVTIVGQVRLAKAQSTNITYDIDDGTGTISVKKWVDSEAQGESGSGAGAIPLDAFVRVWGRLRSLGGKKHVSANFIRQIEDFNEVNYHLLEATYVHLFFTKGAAGGAAKQEGGGDSMFVDQGYGAGGGGDVTMGGAGPTGGGDSALRARLMTCTDNAKTVCNFINNSPGGGSVGVNVHQIAQGTRMSLNDIMKAADELLGQGFIYTTEDDETWAILDY